MAPPGTGKTAVGISRAEIGGIGAGRCKPTGNLDVAMLRSFVRGDADARQLEAIPRDEERVILATGRFAKEELDDSRLDARFLTLPVSWKGTPIQYAGRLHRHLLEKTEAQVFDYVYAAVPMLAPMFLKRTRGYRAMGYEVREGGMGGT